MPAKLTIKELASDRLDQSINAGLGEEGKQTMALQSIAASLLYIVEYIERKSNG